jgi:hypothetical protein
MQLRCDNIVVAYARLALTTILWPLPPTRRSRSRSFRKLSVGSPAWATDGGGEAHRRSHRARDGREEGAEMIETRWQISRALSILAGVVLAATIAALFV